MTSFLAEASAKPGLGPPWDAAKVSDPAVDGNETDADVHVHDLTRALTFSRARARSHVHDAGMGVTCTNAAIQDPLAHDRHERSSRTQTDGSR